MKPHPPKHLSAAARRIFREMVSEYSIHDTGGLKILTAGLEAWDRATKAREVIDAAGMTVTDKFGQVKVHPLCSVERDARAAWLQAIKLLNLDLGGSNEKTKAIQ